MKLPKDTVDCAVVLYKDKLCFLKCRVRKLRKRKLRFKENTDPVRLSLSVVTDVDLRDLTWSFKLNHRWFKLDNCLNSCVSPLLVKFCFSGGEH